MLGTVLGLAIDAVILYRLFDTKLYPATGLWPAGVATAECIIAGDRGGKRAVLLGAGGLTGIAGHLVGIPMDNCGRLLDREHLGAHDARGRLSDPRLCTRYLWSCHRGPLRSARHHGRGGARALGQIVYVIRKRKPKQASEGVDERLGRTLVRGWLAFAMAASVMAAGAGLFAQMSVPSLIAFVVFAAVAALVSELIVGIAAMHSGWFPAFATALIFLVLGMAMGFEPLPLAFLVGFRCRCRAWKIRSRVEDSSRDSPLARRDGSRGARKASRKTPFHPHRCNRPGADRPRPSGRPPDRSRGRSRRRSSGCEGRDPLPPEAARRSRSAPRPDRPAGSAARFPSASW